MADVFGAEEPEAQAASFETDSAAVSVALGRARRGKRGGGDAGDTAEQRFLAAQEALIADQRRHLAAQYKTLALDDWHKRLRLLIQGMTVLAGLLALGAVVWTAWQAHEADGIVIKPFAVPPALAQRGVTGEAVASEIMDRLATMAEIARPTERQKSVDADWGAHIAIEIPETGVSLSQLDQWLREKLGHERHISGEISLGPDGVLKLDARLAGHPLPVQTGPEADLDKMETKVAESIYSREQPISMYQYLGQQGRWQEALDEAAANYRAAKTPEQRAMNLNGMGLAIGNLQGELAAKPYYERALAMTPNINTFVPRNLAVVEFDLGHVERSLALRRLALARERVSDTETPEARRVSELNDQMGIASDFGDYNEALRDALVLSQTNMSGFIGENLADLRVARERIGLHETGAAMSVLQAFESQSKRVLFLKELYLANIDAIAGQWADVPPHADHALALAPAIQNAVVAPQLNSLKARALARLGRIGEAQALVSPLATDCSFCLQARADVAEAGGDGPGADRWFAEWVRQTPSLPAANEAWGRALLARGDAKDALARFDAARAKGPRFADAIEGRGEALLALGDPAGADKAFAEATKLTPRWGRLHLKWGEALAKVGKTDEARAQFRAAAGLDLTAAERAELAKAPR